MTPLTEIALQKVKGGLFTQQEVSNWLDGTPARRYGLVKRALASGEIFRLRRGLYSLSAGLPGGQTADPLTVSYRIYGPSYISLETALSYHECIPEAVYSISSVCLDRSRMFQNPLGVFSYSRIPQKVLLEGVERIETKAGGVIFVAHPIKALADYVYMQKSSRPSVRSVIASLRVDEEALLPMPMDLLSRLEGNYRSRRVRRFLEGVSRELKT